MTSTLLENNKPKVKQKNNFMTNFKLRIKSNKKILIIISILQLIGMPLFMIMAVAHIVSEQYIEMGIYQIMAVIGLGGATLAGIIIAMNNFSYLYKKTDVDMYYSLPMSNRQRFLSDYLSGFTVYVLPYIIASLMALIIHLVASAVYPKWQMMWGSGFTAMLLKGILCGFLIMLMLYTFSILIMACCGSIFETITYIILGNAIIPTTIAVACFAVFNNLFGIGIENIVYNLISYTSPIGGVVAGTGLVDTSVGLSSYWKWLPIYVLITVAMFFGAYFLYKKRKAEDVSKPFVFKMFYYVVLTAITFCIGCIIPASQDESYVAPVIILSAIIYLIFEVVTNRGFKKIHFSIIRYVITMAIVLVMPYIVEKTEGFGMIYNIPSKSNVSSITLQLPSEAYWISQYNNITFEDEDIINNVIDVQEDILTKYKNDNEYRKVMKDNGGVSDEYMVNESVPTDYMTINYHLKNGSVMSRRYRLTGQQQLMLSNILTSKSYIDEVIDTMKIALQIDDTQTTISVDVYNKYQMYSNTCNMDREFIEKLISAYQKDLQNAAVEDLLSGDIYAFIYDSRYPVYSSFKNTVALLKEYKYTPNDIKKELQSYKNLNITNIGDAKQYNNYSSNIYLFTPEQYESFGGNEYTATYGSFVITDDKIHQINFFTNSDIDPDIIKLFEVARANAVVNDDCYVMIFNSQRYIIPKEYNDTAEKVLKDNTISSIMDLQKNKEYNIIVNQKQYYSNTSDYSVASNIEDYYTDYAYDEKAYYETSIYQGFE